MAQVRYVHIVAIHHVYIDDIFCRHPNLPCIQQSNLLSALAHNKITLVTMKLTQAVLFATSLVGLASAAPAPPTEEAAADRYYEWIRRADVQQDHPDGCVGGRCYYEWIRRGEDHTDGCIGGRCYYEWIRRSDPSITARGTAKSEGCVGGRCYYEWIR